MPFTRRPVEFSLSIMEYGSVMVIIFLESTTWITCTNKICSVLSMPGKPFSRGQFEYVFFLIFPRKQTLTFYVKIYCLLRRQFA